MDKQYLLKFLRAIAEGAEVDVDGYKYIVIVDPTYEFSDPPEGQGPYMVIDVNALEKSDIFK